MSNLGGYQNLTSFAKKVHGPKVFVVLLIGGGVCLCKGYTVIKEALTQRLDEKKKQAEAAIVHTVKTEGKSNEGLSFKVDDKFRVLDVYEDAVKIEKLEDNNTYFVSTEFIKSISDYK